MSGPPIIIIDDDQHLVELIQEYLEAKGYSTYTASDGRSAVALAKGRKPGLIILDVDMPFVSGLQALDALRNDAETRPIPIIMLTGVTSDEVYPRIANLPKVSHLKKPIRLEDLGSMVQHYLPQNNQ